ncbi:MAG TPA: hypothetical protein VII94_04345 [Candidatus Saccharimonadales bacterium]
MKIINKLDITTWLHKEKRYQCKTEMEMDAKDLKYKTNKRYSSESNFDFDAEPGYVTDVFYVSCPVCNHDIVIHDNDFGDLAFLIKKDAIAKYLVASAVASSKNKK